MVKSMHRNTLAVGCESPLARGISRNTARYAAFLIQATSFGGSNGMAYAMPVTLRVPRSLTPVRAAAPCESGSAVVHQAQLGISMEQKRTCKKCGFIFSGPQCTACKKVTLNKWREKNAENISEYNKKYRLEHLDVTKANQKKYRDENKEIRKAQFSKWAKNNTDALAKKNKEWKKANPDKVKITAKKWRLSNQGKERAWKEEYYKENSERLKNAATKWRLENPEKRKVYTNNRRKLVKENGGTLSSDISLKLLKIQKGLCACCRKPLGREYHLDHIMPLSLGGSNTDDNMQLLTAKCNMQKHAKHPIDFMQSRGFLL